MDIPKFIFSLKCVAPDLDVVSWRCNFSVTPLPRLDQVGKYFTICPFLGAPSHLILCLSSLGLCSLTAWSVTISHWYHYSCNLILIMYSISFFLFIDVSLLQTRSSSPSRGKTWNVYLDKWQFPRHSVFSLLFIVWPCADPPRFSGCMRSSKAMVRWPLDACVEVLWRPDKNDLCRTFSTLFIKACSPMIFAPLKRVCQTRFSLELCGIIHYWKMIKPRQDGCIWDLLVMYSKIVISCHDIVESFTPWSISAFLKFSPSRKFASTWLAPIHQSKFAWVWNCSFL